MKKEGLRAKALFLRPFNNSGLKSGVIDNEMIRDFSPESVCFQNNSKTIFAKVFQVKVINTISH
ncbi:MAG: hypothetical protein NTV31_09345 [Bacteroidia bacterium]|nr:hypothetical protein [Bacteroidia bacterium]